MKKYLFILLMIVVLLIIILDLNNFAGHSGGAGDIWWTEVPEIYFP